MLTDEEIAQEITAIYRTPTGTMQLRPLQGRAALGSTLVPSGLPGLFTNLSVGLGKAQPNSEPVLTPDGWRPMGDIRPGDFVIGSAGTPVQVLAVHPQGVRPVWRASFSDGSWTRCDPEHLWTFRCGGKPRGKKVVGLKQRGVGSDDLGSIWETRTLEQWVAFGLRRKCGEHQAYKVFAPLVQPVVRQEAELPLDPYTLGALLGDGCMTNAISFVSMDQDILEFLVLPEGVSLRKCSSQGSGLATQFDITKGYHSSAPNPLKEILKGLDLHGCNSETKFIPEMYLRASIQQRLAVLQGLLDTDGHLCNEGGGVEYSTLSTKLAMHVTEIVESLGGTAKHNADAANGNARIYLKLPRHLAPFRCARKGEPYFASYKRQREPYRALVDARPDGEEECTCITVDAWDSLYVTRCHLVTHNSLLAAILCMLHGGERPVVITESSNIPQMRTDFERYRAHFRIPSNYRLVAYEALSSPTQCNLLEEVNPTCVILDEGHKGKHRKKSARARRIDRHRHQHMDVPYFVMSGSPGAGFAQWAHQVLWALPHLGTDKGGRIPVNRDGEPEGPEFRDFCDNLSADPAAHEEFHGWLREQPGVLISAATYTDTPLRITHHILATPPEMAAHWANLRDFGEAPDGWVLDGPGEQWNLARSLSNGMYYEHNPRPPAEYREARKEWYSWVRSVLQWQQAPGGPYDTEGQVKVAVNAGTLPEGAPLLRRWLEIAPTYKPITTTAWLSSAAVEYAIEWGRAVAAKATRESGGGIIWVAQIGLGEELARRTGWPFYGDGARNARRQHVSLADKPGTPPVIIASVNSCGTGKNLQHRFSRALFMSPHSNNESAEQNIGREHRPEQAESVVEVEYLYGCLEDWLAMAKAERQAQEAEQDLTSPRKLRLAEHARCAYPEEGPAWSKGNAVAVVVPDNEK